MREKVAEKRRKKGMVMEGNESHGHHTFENNKSYSSSSSSLQSLPGNSDEFSLFLSQILRRSSSSSVHVAHTQNGTSGCTRSGFGKDGVFLEPYGADCGSASAAAAAANVCSSSVGGFSENETDEHDYESEVLYPLLVFSCLVAEKMKREKNLL